MTRPAPAARGLAATMRPYLPGQSRPGMVKLSSNESPFPPSPLVVERLTEAVTQLNRYPAHEPVSLREVLAAHLTDELVPGRPAVAPDQVLVGNGSVTLLRQIYEAFLEPGDEVVVGWRSFEAYPLFASAREAVEVQVPLVAGQFDLPAIRAAVTERTRLVVLTTPNNPSGAVIAHDDVLDLLAAVPDGCLVVVDHAYAEFERTAGAVRPLDLVAEHPNLLVLRTLSKAYALAGLRVGYGVGHPEVVKAVDTFRSPFEVNALAQVAAAAAVQDAEVALGNVAQLVAQRDRCVAALWAGGLPVGTSQGNFVWLAAGERTPVFRDALLAAGFLSREFPGEGLRISMGTPDQDEAWLAAVLDAWASAPELAQLRERVADAVAAVVAEASHRGIDLAGEGPTRPDLALQATTYGTAALLTA